MGDRDVVLWTTSKLSGAWSARGIVDDLTGPLILQIVDVLSDLDPLIRARLLISLCLVPPDKQAALAASVSTLLQRACSDDSEWVRFFGHAICFEEGSVSLEPALPAFPEVQTTLDSIYRVVDTQDAVTAPSGLPSFEEEFLSDRVMSARGAAAPDTGSNSHFRPRANGVEHGIILQGSQTGLSSVVAAAAASQQQYASLFSGAVALPAARPQKKREAPAAMLVKSTATHYKSATQLRSEANAAPAAVLAGSAPRQQTNPEGPAKRQAIGVQQIAQPSHSTAPLSAAAVSTVAAATDTPMRSTAAALKQAAPQAPAVQAAPLSGLPPVAARMGASSSEEDDESETDSKAWGEVAPNVF